MNEFIVPVSVQPNVQAGPGAFSPSRGPEGVGFKEIMAACLAANAAPETVAPSAGQIREMAAVARELGSSAQDDGILQQLRSRILAELSVALGRDLHDARGDPPNSGAPPGAENGRQPGSLDRIAGGAKPADGKGQAGNESGNEKIATAFAQMLQAKAVPDSVDSTQFRLEPVALQPEQPGRIEIPPAEVSPRNFNHRIAAANEGQEAVLSAAIQARPGAPELAAAEFDPDAAGTVQVRNVPAPNLPVPERLTVSNQAHIMVPRPAADDPVSQPVPAAATEPGPNGRPAQIALANQARAEIGAELQGETKATSAGAGQRVPAQGAEAVRLAAQHGSEGRRADPGFGPAFNAARVGSEPAPVSPAPAAVQAALTQVVQQATAMPAREIRDLTLELDTAGLGRITVKMSMRETEGLVIEMRAGSELAARVLRAELPQLTQMLERHNLSANAQLNVTSSAGFENNPGQSRQQPLWFEHAGNGVAQEEPEIGASGPNGRFHVRWHWAVDLLA